MVALAPSRWRTLEIAVQDPAGAHLALAAGADRVELCCALSVGGLSPSIGLVAAVVDAVDAAPGFVHVLVRPRQGGFVYDAGEVETTVRDIAALRGTGVGGVVVGALTPAGAVDRGAMERFVEAAGGLEVTFHRAIDVCPDPVAAVGVLAEMGATRVLTSGGALRSIDGVDTIAALAVRAAGRLQVMAGGGVGVADIGRLLAAGADSVHLSARMAAPFAGPCGPGGGDDGHDATDAAVVARAVAAIRRFTAENPAHGDSADGPLPCEMLHNRTAMGVISGPRGGIGAPGRYSGQDRAQRAGHASTAGPK
ncbi:copper homeostasis protein CutC [Specibacter cremeus]|uniref:copper homeostasis protein CutC n=1 Tax=Specibacter cremeus TaxID=1629051 RepID=UPI000F7B69FF